MCSKTMKLTKNDRAIKLSIEALGRKLQKGQSLVNEIPEDVDTQPLAGARDDMQGGAA
jgi:hypothetical protein